MIRDLTEEELIIYLWKTDRLGGFQTALLDAISHADHKNLMLLALGFPLEVNAFIRFSTENGWWQNIEWKVKG